MEKHKIEETTYSCNYCNFSTYLKSLLTQHKATHLGKEKMINVYNDSSLIFGTIAVPNEIQSKTIKCPLCSYITLYKENLKSHLLTHAKPLVKQWQCPNCPFKG